MATYQVRGSSHNIIYLYRTDDGKSKQHWETYETELEAIQRKAYIELLQKEKRYDDIRLAVDESIQFRHAGNDYSQLLPLQRSS